ncbi:MAG: L,D-transpeptidase [Polyangiaceae bacterium]|nr:L,D-transpeptidase [Polyangiaceae bacterium]
MSLRARLAPLALLLLPALARAEDVTAPFIDPGDVPLPDWAKTVAPNRADVAIYQQAGDVQKRRGTMMRDARLSLFGAHRGAHCGGRWLSVGPMAWVCSDDVTMSADPPTLGLGLPAMADGLPYRYYFAGAEGADAYDTFQYAGDESPALQMEKGWSVPIVEQRSKGGELWGRTRAGLWIAMRELGPSRPFAFHGEVIPAEAKLDVAWVNAERTNVYPDATAQKKPLETRVRFQLLHVREEKSTREGMFLRVNDDDKPAAWVRAKDIARPSLAAPPSEVSGAATGERWIDVELASQTLVAYQGTTPVFATMVSTGRGAQGSETATPRGVHRIWVKLHTTAMDNLEKEDAEHYYSIEDVPWVQFFDKGVALHAAFWHREFGRVRSHGCVNMAPLDAHRMFAFTGPHIPSGWAAALPTPLEPGTWVRVR